MSQAAPKEFSWRVVQTTSFLEVVNANPQKRQNVVVHHLDVAPLDGTKDVFKMQTNRLIMFAPFLANKCLEYANRVHQDRVRDHPGRVQGRESVC